MDHPTSHVQNVPIDAIDIGNRMRPVEPRQVAALQSTIAAIGLMHPITVFAVSAPDEAAPSQRWGLIVGAHRLAACRALGWSTINVNVVTYGDLQRQIAECDENLCGPRVGPARRAKLTALRKEAYEALHPETRNGATGSGREKVRQNGEAKRFTQDTAALTGKSERSVQRDAELGNAIDKGVLDEITDTDLDTGVALKQLIAVPKHEQPAKVEELKLKAAAGGTKRVARCSVDAAETTPAEQGASAAADWLFKLLGSTNAAVLSDMLAQEESRVFVDRFIALARIRESSPTSDDGVPMAESPALEADCTVVPQAPAAPSAPSQDEQMSLVDYIKGLAAPENPPKTSTWEIGLQRASNWRDIDDEPKTGNFCQSCKGMDWWGGKFDPSGWHCAGCFVPKPGDRKLRHLCTRP